MIAAIYARKSTEQAGVADDQKSIARQVEHARQYAAGKGWTVADGHIYADDGISGAEFSARPGLVRLLNALKPRPAFQILILSEVARLGREQIETAMVLKQLSTAGVRCFAYLDGREILMESATDKFLLAAVNFGAELEREKGAARTYDAMRRLAAAGHVTGGRVFGYDNVAVLGPDGKRSHVQRAINEAEAAVVREIFARCAAGHGYPRIARGLNDEGAPAPRSQRGRPAGWAPSSIREILFRPLYRGDVVWNRTRKRDRCLPGCLPKRHAPFDDGYRPHQIEIWPDHADRAYVAYIDGGAMVFDIADLAQVKSGRIARYTPRLLGRRDFHPPFPAWTHTFQPMFARRLAWASDEDVMDNCKDAPKLVWLLDIRDETNPVIVATAPLHANDGELCSRGGRFGAHNLHPNFPGPLYANLQNTTVASWFNGGVRIFRATDGPKGVTGVPQIEELGFYIPAAPPRNPSKTIQINHAIVGADGLIYANDRFAGGLYILRYTGTVPLD